MSLADVQSAAGWGALVLPKESEPGRKYLASPLLSWPLPSPLLQLGLETGWRSYQRVNSLTLERNMSWWLYSWKSLRCKTRLYRSSLLHPANPALLHVGLSETLKSGLCYPIKGENITRHSAEARQHTRCKALAFHKSACNSLDWLVRPWHLWERGYLQVRLVANGVLFLESVAVICENMPNCFWICFLTILAAIDGR